MLLILFSWFYILCVSFVYGHALISLLAGLVKEKPLAHFSVYILCGFLLLSVLSNYLSLFINIGLTANALLLLGALIYCFAKGSALRQSLSLHFQSLRNAPAVSYLIALVAVGIGLSLSAIPDAKFDDGLYYRQSIQWIEQYPVVTGLGNLHLKFSFNSSWHMLSALFSFSFLGISFNDLNGIFLLITTLFAMQGLVAVMQRNFMFSDIFRIMTIAPLHLIYHYIISPSPDFVIPALLWIIFVLFLQKVEQHTLTHYDLQSLLITVLSVFAVVIKLSAAPVAILPAYLLFLQLRKNNYRIVTPLAAVVLFLITPWFIRNVIISGYLVYPVYQIDLFSFDWKIPAELVKLEVLETRAFAKVRNMLFSEVESLSLSEWLPYWFRQLGSSEKLAAVLVLICSLLIPGWGIYKLSRSSDTEQKTGYAILILTVYAGILFWFASAPHFRYGMGFTVATYLLCAAYGLYLLARRYSSAAFPAAAVLLLVFCAKPAFDAYKYYQKAGQPIAVYPGKIRYKQPLPVLHAGTTIYVPDSTAQCWNAPLPCAPFVVDGLELRTGNIEDGFRINKPDPELYSQKRLESMKVNGVSYNFLQHNPVK